MPHSTDRNSTFGIVRGTDHGSFITWKGIPYAAPPVGDLRFASPQPHSGWSGIRDCTQFGHSAMQMPGPLSLAAPPEVTQSEDCLTLNIWAPSSETDLHGVMVWIHGGASTVGSGAEYFYDGTNLATHQNIVVVTINYRLGIFGGLAIDDDAIIGTNMIQDTMAALTWVKQNISAFNGDPSRVTVAGESAGACIVAALLTSPKAEGLFDQAIIDSGHAAANADRSLAHLSRDLHMEELGLSRNDELLSAMRAMTTDQLLSAQQVVTQKMVTAFKPVEDGHIVPVSVMDAMSHGNIHRVPVLLGTNRDEHNLFAAIGSGHNVGVPGTPIRKRLEAILVNPSAEEIEQVASVYSPLSDDEDQQWNVLCTDRDWRGPQRQMADLISDTGVPVFRYEWAFPSTRRGGTIGAGHAVDLPFFFDNLHQPGVDQLIGTQEQNPQRDLVAKQSSDVWGSFVRTGVPSSTALPEWPLYKRTDRMTMIIKPDAEVINDPHGSRLDLWAEVATLPPLFTPYVP